MPWPVPPEGAGTGAWYREGVLSSFYRTSYTWQPPSAAKAITLKETARWTGDTSGDVPPAILGSRGTSSPVPRTGTWRKTHRWILYKNLMLMMKYLGKNELLRKVKMICNSKIYVLILHSVYLSAILYKISFVPVFGLLSDFLFYWGWIMRITSDFRKNHSDSRVRIENILANICKNV